MPMPKQILRPPLFFDFMAVGKVKTPDSQPFPKTKVYESPPFVKPIRGKGKSPLPKGMTTSERLASYRRIEELMLLGKTQHEACMLILREENGGFFGLQLETVKKAYRRYKKQKCANTRI